MSVDAGPEIYGKRLTLLREAAPSITRLGVIHRQGGQGQPWHKILTMAAEKLHIALVQAPVGATTDYATAFATLRREKVDALLASDTSLNRHNQRLIIDFATERRLPTVYAFRESVEAGGLLAYGVDVVAIYRRAAEYVDRVLRGTKPADLPVEQPTKFEFVVNLRTAKALGLTIPPSVLARADHVIE